MTDANESPAPSGGDGEAAAKDAPAPAPAEAATSVAEHDQLLDHNYDGIQEYDNPLPGWWSGTFIATIVFSAIYVVYYHLGPGPLVADEYRADVAAKETLRAESAGPTYTDADLAALTDDTTALASGAELFQTRCASCHGPQGQGLIGPNLCDEYWIHGGSPTQIHHTIRVGVPAKGMISWDKLLSPTELAQVTAFVLSLRGTNPPGAKAPEGDKVE